jgi:integrase
VDLSLELLRHALQDGTIEATDFLESLRRESDMNERHKYLDMHEYKIYQGKDGNWYTYVPDDFARNKRKKLKRKTEQELDDAIVAFYKQKEIELTVGQTFSCWLEEKLEFGEIKKQSYDRYKNQYKRFFTNLCYPMDERKIKYVTELEIETFIKTIIAKLKLTQKSYYDMCTLLRGIWKYGKKHGLTTLSITNCMGDLAVSKKAFKPSAKTRESEVFNEDEIPTVMSYLRKQEDVYNLGLQLAFYTGLRVGELSGLKYSDYRTKRIKRTGETLHILVVQRTEVKFRDADEKWKLDVQDFTKTEAGMREIILNEACVQIIEKLHKGNPFGEYLFMNRRGKRIRGNSFNKRLNLVCDQLGLPHRSMHKIRKTYGTILIDSDMDESLIAQMMGHKDIATTKQYYYFANQNDENRARQMQKALGRID